MNAPHTTLLSWLPPSVFDADGGLSSRSLLASVAVLLAVGALLPWVTFDTFEGATHFAAIHRHDVALGAVLAATLLGAATIGRSRPLVGAGLVTAAAGLLLWGLGWNLVPLLPRYRHVPGDALGEQVRRTVSGLEHGGGWVLLFAATGLGASAVRGAPRDRAAAATVVGVVSLGVAGTVAVPATVAWGDLDPAVGSGLVLVLVAGAIALAAGIAGLLQRPERGRSWNELLVLGGSAIASVGVLLPWWSSGTPSWTMPGWGGYVSAWSTLNPLAVGLQPRWYALFLLLCTCPLAALVLADGLTVRRSWAVALLGSVLLALAVGPLVGRPGNLETLLVGGDSLVALGAVMLLTATPPKWRQSIRSRVPSPG